MIFGLMSVGKQDELPELCIFPDKPSPFSRPIRVTSLMITDCSLHFSSVEEGFIVNTDPSDNGVIISAVRPNVFYLTPNLPHRPGFRVDRMKVLALPEGRYTVFYDRGKGWENWNPNRQIL